MTIRIPSTLAFKSGLMTSDAPMYAEDSTGTLPTIKVPIEIRSTLGTQSQFTTEPGDDQTTGNPQRVEKTKLPDGYDTLLLKFTGVITGQFLEPEMCGNGEYLGMLRDFTARMKSERSSIQEIANRYACNILNGSWGWRNTIMGDSAVVTVSFSDGQTIEADCFAVPPVTRCAESDEVRQLGARFAAALFGETRLCRFEATLKISSPWGSEIWPSQEFVDSKDPNEPSRKLFSIGGGAGLHDVKVGNAIRRIDTWHGGDQTSGIPADYPAPVEPWGTMTRQRTALRLKKNSLYDYLPILSSLAPESDEAKFVFACLIRGGVYGGISEKKEKEQKKKQEEKKAKKEAKDAEKKAEAEKAAQVSEAEQGSLALEVASE